MGEWHENSARRTPVALDRLSSSFHILLDRKELVDAVEVASSCWRSGFSRCLVRGHRAASYRRPPNEALLFTSLKRLC